MARQAMTVLPMFLLSLVLAASFADLTVAAPDYSLVSVQCGGFGCTSPVQRDKFIKETCDSANLSLAYVADAQELASASAVLAGAVGSGTAYVAAMASTDLIQPPWYWLDANGTTTSGTVFAIGYAGVAGFQSYVSGLWRSGYPSEVGGRFVKLVMRGGNGALENMDGYETSSYYVMCDKVPRDPPFVGTSPAPSDQSGSSAYSGDSTPTDPLDAKPSGEFPLWTIGLICVVALIIAEAVTIVICCCCCAVAEEEPRESDASKTDELTTTDATGGGLNPLETPKVDEDDGDMTVRSFHNE